MSTTTTALGLVLEERDSTVDGSVLPVERVSKATHVAALAVLAAAGKAIGYTADEYIQAVTIARRKHQLPDVHTAMSGRGRAHVGGQ
jgi:hypothetical protein